MNIQKAAIVLLPVFWPNFPPLSLAYLKGFLVNKGISIEALDANIFFYQRVSEQLKREWRKSCNKDLEKNILTILQEQYPEVFSEMLGRLLQYDSIGFSCYKSNFSTTKQIACLLKKKKPKIRILFGGPEITSQYFKFQDDLPAKYEFVDFFIVGEGELPLYNFFSNTYSGPLAVFQELGCLDESPGPDYSDFHLPSYPRQATASLMLSRGCIKRCRFCAERLLYKKFRLPSIDNSIEQIKRLQSKGFKTFIFHDSLINGKLSWLEDFCDQVIKNFGSIPWEAQMAIRPDMTDRLIDKIKRSGCYHLFIGLESGCGQTLEDMKKGYTPDEALEFFKKLKRARLSFGVSILVGFPSETVGNFQENLSFIIRNKEYIPKIEQVNPFVYYAGLSFPESSDYKTHPESLERALFFIEKIKEAGFKYTNAFLLNLVEPNWK